MSVMTLKPVGFHGRQEEPCEHAPSFHTCGFQNVEKGCSESCQPHTTMLPSTLSRDFAHLPISPLVLRMYEVLLCRGGHLRYGGGTGGGPTREEPEQAMSGRGGAVTSLPQTWATSSSASLIGLSMTRQREGFFGHWVNYGFSRSVSKTSPKIPHRRLQTQSGLSCQFEHVNLFTSRSRR